MQVFLQKKEQQYVVLPCEDRYLLVKIDKGIKPEHLNDIQCEKDVRAKGLTWETILKKDFRSVTVTGGAVGDRVTFALKKGSRSYALFRKHRVEEIEACFEGTEIKKKRHSHQDFRKNVQSEKGLKTAKRVAFILNLIAVAVFIGIMLSNVGDKAWGAIGLAVSLVSLVVYVFCPRYFSLFEKSARREFGYTAEAFCLAPALAGPSVVMFVKLLTSCHIEKWWMLSLITLGITAVVTPLLCCFVRELRDTGAQWAVVALMLLLCTAGIVGEINLLFASPAEETTEQCTVVEMDDGYRGRGTIHFCTVRPEIGLAKRLPVSSLTYFRLEIGDTVMVHQVKGALGIEYTYLLKER